MSATLIYCYDPMCSWCWGFQPTWKALQLALEPYIESGEIQIQPMLGGLAVDSNAPMPLPMQTKLAGVWKQIESQLGTKFNHNFWQDCQPRRSTYPACRACLVARDQNLEKEMSAQIQQAYYLNAQNPSDLDTLAQCATNIGLKEDGFLKAMEHCKKAEVLEQEVQIARQLGLNSFPSIALVMANQMIQIPLDYLNADQMLTDILAALAQLKNT